MDSLQNDVLPEHASDSGSVDGAPASGVRVVGSQDSQCRLSHVTAALAAVDELAACRDSGNLLRVAIELARSRLGLERVGLFLRDRASERIVMRGTWGTGARGETTDERALSHEFAPREYNALLSARLSGGLGMYRHCAPLFACEPGRTVVIGEGWVMATPLVAARDVVGVMYNDSALTHTPVDEGKQAGAAVFCTMLAVLYQSRRGGVSWQPLPRKSGQAPLVERVLRALTPAAEKKGLSLALVRCDAPETAVGDPVRIAQVLGNLVMNAIKFTAEGGRVRVVLRRAGDAAEIVVSDTGVGIAPEFLPHVFERFQQADGTMTRRYGGLGLGLAIVKHLVERHGGTVSAHSDGEGQGATFSILLPVASTTWT